jgi:hypothetical protein
LYANRFFGGQRSAVCGQGVQIYGGMSSYISSTFTPYSASVAAGFISALSHPSATVTLCGYWPLDNFAPATGCAFGWPFEEPAVGTELVGLGRLIHVIDGLARRNVPCWKISTPFTFS